MAPKLIVICGPTATGKTKLGVALAQRLGGEVVSADSMQVYRDMAIGTARPTPEEMAGVPHHMMGVVDPRENYSVARYVQEATAWVEDILRRGKQPILVGGTGLYIDGLCQGRTYSDFQPEIISYGIGMAPNTNVDYMSLIGMVDAPEAKLLVSACQLCMAADYQALGLGNQFGDFEGEIQAKYAGLKDGSKTVDDVVSELDAVIAAN